MPRARRSKQPHTRKQHLFVIQHGFMGNAAHTAYLATHIQEQHGDAVVVLNSTVNEKKKTMDGVQAAGERLYQAIITALEGNKFHSISMIGYSYGGIIARYAAGLLYDDGVFESVNPVNFISFASPHLGSRRSPGGVFNRMFNHVANWWCTTTQQLVLQDMDGVDCVTGHSVPILYQIAQSESIFIQALSQFTSLTAYANIGGDRSVGFSSASLLPRNPYRAKHALVQPHDHHAKYPHVMNVWAPAPSSDRLRHHSVRRRRVPGAQPRRVHSPPHRNAHRPGTRGGSRSSGSDEYDDYMDPSSVSSTDSLRSTDTNSYDEAYLGSDDAESSAESASATADFDAILIARRLPNTLLYADELSLLRSGGRANDRPAPHRSSRKRRRGSPRSTLRDGSCSSASAREREGKDTVTCGAGAGRTQHYGNDDKRDMLQEMLTSLNTLPWRRVDVSLPGPNTHGQIIVRRQWWYGAGKDVIAHCVDTVTV
eukprot:TRINITY_DN36666_c0_g1_i1.p1 TRINITY_DN36666_c0_g1~~TRINITY_DN36666_c0_g1_i1.p1  ORF type:complete len:483 (-),score=65.60 TRINITY_DN36666_c0_g1_i1:21-1469(-)